MKKTGLLLMLFFITTFNYAQNCDCSSNLSWLVETFENNDAGFQYVIDQKGENAYLAHNNNFTEKASKIKDKTECLNLLNDWTEFFRKNHLQVVLNEKSNSSANQKELTEKEIVALYQNSPKFEIKKADFEKSISNIKTKNSFEGVWSSDPYTIGIIQDNDNPERDYVGFIIKSGSPYWQVNQIKLEIFKQEDGTHDMKYYMRNHTVREIKHIDIAGYNYLIADFIVLKRIKPVLKTDPNTTLFFKSMNAEKPFIENISDHTVLLRIPSFRHSEKKGIDSLLANNKDLLSKTENLIIDLRNNGGGSDASYQKIIPYLYTNPIRGLGVQYLSTQLNNKRMQDFINDPDWDTEDKEWAKEGLEKLNKHMGEFINLNDNIVSIDTLDTVMSYPKNIGILINGNCGSTTEQFLLAAKQSKKTKLFGTTTLGSLDISNMYSVDSPSGEFKLWYGLTKSYRIPEMLIDGKGIQPDFYFDKTIKPYEWINKTMEILSYQ